MMHTPASTRRDRDIAITKRWATISGALIICQTVVVLFIGVLAFRLYLDREQIAKELAGAAAEAATVAAIDAANETLGVLVADMEARLMERVPDPANALDRIRRLVR